MSNIEEYWYGTNPHSADTDDDGLTDGWEIAHNFDPNDDSGNNGAAGDPDDDGLTNLQEQTANSDPHSLDSDSDGLTDGVEFGLGTNLTNQDGDSDAIPDSIDSEPFNSAQAFADADGDGIPDGVDPSINNPRGAKPTLSSVNASGNPLSNLIVDQTQAYVLTISNPAGTMPQASDLTLYVNGTVQAANITPLDDGSMNNRRFILKWNATTTAGYPTQTLQNLSLRFKDPQQATAWLNLARIDVAEWEGMLTGLRMDSSPNVRPAYLVRSHNAGKFTRPEWLIGDSWASHQSATWYRGPKSISLLNTNGGGTGNSAQITNTARYPFFLFLQSTGNPVMIDISDPDTYPDKGTFYKNWFSLTVDVKEPSAETLASGVRKFVKFPQEDPRDLFNMVPIHFTYWDPILNQERVISESNLRYIDGTSERIMWMIEFYEDSIGPRKLFRQLFFAIGARISPHSAGTLEYPGLPINIQNLAPDPYNPSLLPIQSEQWHKLVLKVGPDAGAISDGIQLKLGSGETGDAAPQSGFTFQVLGANGLAPLAFPSAGEMPLTPASDHYKSLVSPAGLTLFVKCNSNISQSHRLSLNLLPKPPAPQPDKLVRIAALDLLPVEVVPDYNRDGKIDSADRGKVTDEKPWRW